MPDENPGPGHNSGLPYDPAVFDQHNTKGRSWLDAAGAWLDKGVIETKEDAEGAKSWIEGARKVKEGIDSTAKAEKAPHQNAVAQIADAYDPLSKAIDLAIKKMRPMLQAFLDRERAEAERVKREAAAAAEKLREAAEQARLRAEQANDTLGQVEAEKMAKAAEKATKAAAKPVNVSIGGGTGKAMATVTQRVAVIEDQDLAYLEVKNVPGVQEAIQSALNAIVRAKDFNGRRLRGVRVDTKESIR